MTTRQRQHLDIRCNKLAFSQCCHRHTCPGVGGLCRAQKSLTGHCNQGVQLATGRHVRGMHTMANQVGCKKPCTSISTLLQTCAL